MKDNKLIYRIINGKDEHRRLDRRYVFLGLFIFVMVATFSFFYTRGMKDVDAVDLSGFKAGNIISDAVMRNYTSMTEADIQKFLDKKNSCDKAVSSVSGIKKATGESFGIKYQYKYTYDGTTYYYHVEDGKFVCLNNEKFNGETAAHIIYQAAQDYKINPQVLIVLLQKEQGLITDKWPNINHQYRSATGYGCPDNKPCNSEYYGFKNQVRWAADLFDDVLSGGWSTYPVGTNTIRWSPKASCGGSKVNIENRATSALYRYTPYQPNAAALKAGYGAGDSCSAYGNRNFYAYFTDWFGSTQTVATSQPSIQFPEETFVLEVGEGKYLVPLARKKGSKLIVTDNVSEINRQYKFTKTNDGYYVLTHVNSGLVIDISDGDAEEGVLQLNNADSKSESQKWRLTISTNGYTLRSAVLDNRVISFTGDAEDEKGVNLQFYATGSTKQTIKVVAKSEAPIENESIYYLETSGGKAMDLEGGKTANATKIIIYDPSQHNRQQFQFIRGIDGFYTIKNVASDKVLDVANGSTANGAKVQLYTSNNSCAQKWLVEKTETGYRFLSSCSGKAIDVPSGKVSTNSQKLQIYTANGTAAQSWALQELNAIEDGEYIIESTVGKNYVVDIAGGAKSAKNGTNIQIYTSNGTTAQMFNVKYDETAKAYSIINTQANRSLDVDGASTASGANIQVWNSNKTCAQYWHIHKNSDGTYNIFSACSDKALDVAGAKAKNNTNIQTYTFNNSKAQKWTFKSVQEQQ